VQNLDNTITTMNRLDSDISNTENEHKDSGKRMIEFIEHKHESSTDEK